MPVRTRLLPRTTGLAAVAGALLLVLLASAAPASATTPRLRVTFAPATLPPGAPAGTVPAGAAAATVHADLVNPSGAERVGSANLVPPAGFVVSHVSLPPRTGRAGVNAATGTVELRGLSVNANSSLRVTLTLQAPCEAPSPSTWGVTAKKSTSYSGTALALSSTSALATGVRGTCTLRWDPEPNDVELGYAITSARYDDDGDAVGVAVHDGDGVRVVPPRAEGVAVRFDPPPSNDAGLSGATSTLDTTSGYATFGALKVTQAGTYGLRAAVTSGRFAGLVSTKVTIRVDAFVEECVALKACLPVAASGGPARFSVTAGANPDAGAGFLTLSVDAGLQLEPEDCDDYEGFTTSTALFDETSQDRTKILSVTVDKLAMNAESDNGAARLEVCFASPRPFDKKLADGRVVETEVSTRLSFDWDADGDDAGGENDVYTGRLPDCTREVELCVTQRKKTGAGDGYIEATVPPGLGDPAMRT